MYEEIIYIYFHKNAEGWDLVHSINGKSLPWNLIFRFPTLFITSVIPIRLAFCQESMFFSIPKDTLLYTFLRVLILLTSHSIASRGYTDTWGALALNLPPVWNRVSPVALHPLFAWVSQAPPPEPHIYSGSKARVWKRAGHQIKLSSLSPPEFRITRPGSKYSNAKARFHT